MYKIAYGHYNGEIFITLGIENFNNWNDAQRFMDKQRSHGYICEVLKR